MGTAREVGPLWGAACQERAALEEAASGQATACSETAAGDSGLGGGVKFRQIVLGGETTGIMSAKHVETSGCECVT